MYPPIARAAGVEGEVKLRLEVSSSGNVTKVEAIAGHSFLQHAAIENVKLWRFHCDDCDANEPFHHEMVYVFKLKRLKCDFQSPENWTVEYSLPSKIILTRYRGASGCSDCIIDYQKCEAENMKD